MASIIVTQEAIDYINEKRSKRSNIIIYRDVSGIIMSYTTRRLTFEPRVKLTDKEPNELFVIKDNSYGFPIWVERGLLPVLTKYDAVRITRKSFKRGLDLQLGSGPNDDFNL